MQQFVHNLIFTTNNGRSFASEFMEKDIFHDTTCKVICFSIGSLISYSWRFEPAKDITDHNTKEMFHKCFLENLT